MLSDTLAKIDMARVVVAELTYGEREWKGLHEPASDVVIMEALRCAAREIARLTRELEEARERERAVRDEATGYLAEVAGTLADMHDGEECRFEGGEGCLACYAQRRIGEMQDALAAAPLEKWTHNHGGEQ